ncbi:MAG: hypothetical protein M3Z03_14565 [Actinomycetota bacterium]|nr:hypothetical protein [Actinomycetota bacterium]
MRIRALSVFEGIVYHCWCVDPSNPQRPTLEVDALLRPGDADASSGPLLLSVADYLTMVDGDRGPACLDQLREKGRLVEHLGVPHISFPTWTAVATADERNELEPDQPG